MAFLFGLGLRRPLYWLALAGFCLQIDCARTAPQPASASSSANAVSFASSADGQRIAYRTIGHGEVTVILSHCWGCTSLLWDDTASRLGQRYRFVLVDLPGHGQSTGTRRAWTVEAYAQDLAAVVRAVGGAPVILVGHSMSGRIVLEAARDALRGRVRGIVLVDSVPDVGRIPGEAERSSLVPRLRSDFASTVREVVSGLEPPNAQPTVRRVSAMIEAMAPNLAADVLDQNLRYPLRERLASVEVPLWSVNAALTATNEQENRRLVPNWQERVVPGTGHWLMLDAPEPFAAALDLALQAILVQNSEHK